VTGPSISHNQLWVATLGLLVTKVFYPYPRGAAVSAGAAAPWTELLSAGVAFLLFLPVLTAMATRPGKNFVDLTLEVGGRPLAIISALGIAAFLIGANAIRLRVISELAVAALYPFTPQTFLMGSLVFTAVVGAWVSPQGLAWLTAMVTWPTVVGILGLLAGCIGWVTSAYLFPLTGTGAMAVARAVFPMTSHYSELLYAAVLAGFVSKPHLLPGAIGKAVGVTCLVSAATVLIFLMVFPYPGVDHIPFPLFELTRLIQGGRFLERTDGLWVLFLTFGSALLLAIALQVSALLLQQAFRMPTHRDAIVPLAMAMLAGALFPSNQAAAIVADLMYFRRWGFVIALVLPMLIAGAAYWRRRRANG